MIALEPGDKIRAVDHIGTHPPIYGTVFLVHDLCLHVTYEERTGIGGIDIYYRESLWRAYDRQSRWRLELVRECPWCETDISGPGEAMPTMHGRLPRVNQNWQCSDRIGCLRRQFALDERDLVRAGMSVIIIDRGPIAALEASA